MIRSGRNHLPVCSVPDGCLALNEARGRSTEPSLQADEAVILLSPSSSLFNHGGSSRRVYGRCERI